jgi:hypothetical protein
MGLIVMLLVNGVIMTRLEAKLSRSSDNGVTEALWSQLRNAATRSAVLWITVVLAGTILTKI